MTHTRTHTYTVIRFADPYKTCDECGAWIEGTRSNPAGALHPCGHRSSYTDHCPSWGPVDGCRCVEELGHTDHGEPSGVS